MKQILSALFAVGAIMVLVGAAVYITGWIAAPYVYTVGATLVALAQINTRPHVQNSVIRRLRFQQILGAYHRRHLRALYFRSYSTGGGERVEGIKIGKLYSHLSDQSRSLRP